MKEKTKTIVCVVGARPNFMKIAAIMRAFSDAPGLRPYLVHTGQHYDAAMKHAFFDQLGIPQPDIDLGVGSGTHAQQTADIMKRFEPILDGQNPVAILVVGDVNSTIACSLVAAKKGIFVIHVEAGLRSNDRTMPEEINRVLTDQLSALLFTTEKTAVDNLKKEGISEDKVHFVGNVMIDTLLQQRDKAVPASDTLAAMRHANNLIVEKQVGDYALLTLHRPSNVDDPAVLSHLLQTLANVSERLPIIFPLHPRTEARIKAAAMEHLVDLPTLLLLPPQGYLEMLGLMMTAKMVLTDSGGIQEETTALGIPCITLRDNTERPITVTQGTNTIVGTNAEKILASVDDILLSGGKAGHIPEKWDGRAAERIVKKIDAWLETI